MSVGRMRTRWPKAVVTVSIAGFVVIGPVVALPSVGDADPVGRAAAQANGYAAGVLSAAVLPSGAHKTSNALSSLRMVTSALLPFAVENEYDTHAFYTDAESPTRVASYITSHVPRGTWDGAPLAPGEDQIRVQLPMSGPDFVYSQDIYTIVGHGKGSEFRVDAEVDWSPTRTAAEDAPFSGKVVVTATTCVQARHGQCRPHTVRVFGTDAERIRVAFDRLAPSTGPLSCNVIGGGLGTPRFRVAFVPKGHSASTVSVKTVGCGKVAASTPGGQPLALVDGCAFQRSVAAVLPPGEGSWGGQYAPACPP